MTWLAMWVCAALVILPLTVSGAEKKKTPRVNGVYKQLDLTEDQATKISDIQKATSEQIKALKAQERESILTELTDAQKEKLAAIEAEKKNKKSKKQEPEAEPEPDTAAQ
jgi:Spy/CpxP family protein refolding chaperone